MSNKQYKKGFIDASNAYTQFGRKQARAVEVVLEEVRKGNKTMADALDELKTNVGDLYDYLSKQEKSSLYTVYTPYDIRELGAEERLYVVGALCRLTEDYMPTETQRNYLRAVMKYLRVAEIPHGVNPLAISNVESTEDQKCIFQVVVEFLLCQDSDHYDNTELQNNFLNAFQLSEATKSNIIKHVECLYIATGPTGLSEKYEYVANKPDPLYDTAEEVEVKEPPVIPFFKLPITIVYTDKDKSAEQMADLLKARIDSKLDAMDVKHEVGTCTNVAYKEQKAAIEKEGQVIFIGIPPEAKATSKNITWQYDEYGMQFGTEGRKSIINISPLKKKQYTGFIDLAKKEQEKLHGKEVPLNVQNSEMTFLKDWHEETKDTGVLGIIANTVMSPLLLVGIVLDGAQAGVQQWINSEAKDQITLLQHIIAIEKFLDSKINPYIQD